MLDVRRSVYRKFCLSLVILFVFPYCSSSSKNKSIIDISIDKTNPLWLERDVLCSKKIPFCHREFWLKKNTQDTLPEKLTTLSKVWSANKIRGRLYVFTLFKNPTQKLYVLPALPVDMNQKNFHNWFSKNIFSPLLKNPIFLKKESVHYRKKSWSIQGIQLLHKKCTLNIYPKVIEYPFVFVFLWEGLPSNLENLYQKIEDWSIQQFKAFLSPHTSFENEHNI